MGSVNKINDLISGYKDFQKEYFTNGSSLRDLYHDLLKKGQFPKALFIACSDSRIDPALVTNAQPGDIFSVRNVANLVPPYQEDSSTYHGTSSAIDFGVNGLNIENIVVMGHSHCAGVAATVQKVLDKMNTQKPTDNKFSFVSSWIKIAEAKVAQLIENHPMAHKEDFTGFANFCAMELIKNSIDNLMSFPFIKEKVEAGKLNIYGWYFDIESGKLLSFNKQQDKYIEL